MVDRDFTGVLSPLVQFAANTWTELAAAFPTYKRPALSTATVCGLLRPVLAPDRVLVGARFPAGPPQALAYIVTEFAVPFAM